MMKILGLVALVLAVTAAHPTQKSRVRMMFGDEYKSYRFEEHDIKDGKHFVLVVKDTPGHEECHVVDIDGHFNDLLNDSRLVRKITKNIYQYIRWVHDSEHEMTAAKFKDLWEDDMASKECKNHTIFWLPAFSPSVQLTDADKPTPDDDFEIGPKDHWDFECDPEDGQQVKSFFDYIMKAFKKNENSKQ